MGKKVKGNGEGTIYKSSKTGLHVGQYTDKNGKRHTVYQKKNEQTREFKARFNKIITSLNDGTYIEKSTETLIDILENHIKQKHEDGIISDGTYVMSINQIKIIQAKFPELDKTPIQKISIECIEKHKSNLKDYSNGIIDKVWGLMYIGKIPFNIMDDETLTKPISNKQTKKVEALTIEEQEKLIHVLDNEERKHKYRNIVKVQLLSRNAN